MEPFVTAYDRFLFAHGTHYEIYDKLGAHPGEQNGAAGTHFAVWAPQAQAVSLLCDRSGWQPGVIPLEPLPDGGIWAVFVPGLGPGTLYKYGVLGCDGQLYEKADPYAFAAQLRPDNASVVARLEGYDWQDGAWLAQDFHTAPMSIYEVHLGSWKKDYARGEDGFLDYRTLAHQLGDYVRYMGYTHVELMGIAEHPLDASWGYQVTGYYAPTARYGAPEDLMYLVDYLHRQGIGVLLDWVPCHFPRDAVGLSWFDGAPLYEYADPRRGEHPEWGTKFFDLGRPEVSNFLLANALFWIERYHIDGLRVDAVAFMLYRGYGRAPGTWENNVLGDDRNLESLEFFHHLSSVLRRRAPRALLMAEDSSIQAGVTTPADEGGIGFSLKWNMGWMHDFLEYLKLDPVYRQYHHEKMVYTLSYAFLEQFILPLSHDEVVHLKKPLVYKIPGNMEDKLGCLKTAYCWMLGHPGKKLLFMGQDFAETSEWMEDRSLDWYLADQPGHRDVMLAVRRLLRLYRTEPALWDDRPGTFEWLNGMDAARSCFSFIRQPRGGEGDTLVFICNFTPVEWRDYVTGVPKAGVYRRLFTTYPDEQAWSVKAVRGLCDGRPAHLDFCLRPYESVIFRMPRPRRRAAPEKEAVSGPQAAPPPESRPAAENR